MPKALATLAVTLVLSTPALAQQAPEVPPPPDKKGVLLLLSLIDIYGGVSGGIGSSRIRSDHNAAVGNRVYPVVKIHQTSGFFGGYGGIGLGPVAVEGGTIRLPGYRSYVVGSDPPRFAYQKIDGDAKFVRGLLRAPPSWGWAVQPYLFFGGAVTYGSNHELGSCPICGRGYVPDWHNWTREKRPYLGFGAEVPIIPHLSMRAEIGYLPSAINSFWTGDRNYTLGSVSLQARF